MIPMVRKYKIFFLLYVRNDRGQERRVGHTHKKLHGMNNEELKPTHLPYSVQSIQQLVFMLLLMLLLLSFYIEKTLKAMKL